MLQKEGKNVAFMEPHTVRQIKQCITIIQEYALENEKVRLEFP